MNSKIFLFGFENIVELIKSTGYEYAEVKRSKSIKNWILISLKNGNRKILSIDLIKDENELFIHLDNLFHDT